MRKQKLKLLFSALLVGAMALCTKALPVYADSGQTQYKLNAAFDEGTKTFTVSETVKFKNNYGEELKDVVFHLYADSYNRFDTMPAFSTPSILDRVLMLAGNKVGDIDITEVKVNGNSLDFTQDNELLKIKFVKPLLPEEEINIAINFTLKMPLGTSRLGYSQEVYSLTNWYPILSIYDKDNDSWDERPFNPIGESNYSDVADYEFSLQVPAKMKIASTGIDVKEEVKDEVKTIETKAENVRDFVFIMSPKFKTISKEVNGVKVNSFYIDRDNKNDEKKIKDILDITCESVEFFSNKFGQYPYPELDLVETYLAGGAMEYPQLIQMPSYSNVSSNIFRSALSDFVYEAAVHETGHQWWYVTVGNDEFKEAFLDEALTTFSTAYFFEAKEGKYSSNAVYASIRNRVYPNAKNTKPINLPVDKFSNMGEYSNTIYSRGSMVFEDLRQRVGEEKFLIIMQKYFEQNKFKNATTRGLLSVIENEAGEETAKAIDAALNKPNYYPKNIELSDEDRQELYRYQTMKYIEQEEKTNGMVLGSIGLRALRGEKIYIVLPSDSSGQYKNVLDSQAKNLKSYIKDVYKAEAIIRSDKEITEKDKKEGNFIIIGEIGNNKILDEISNTLPLKLTSNGFTLDDIVVTNKDVSGIFAAQSPYKEENVVIVVYSNNEKDNDTYMVYGLTDSTDQFVFKIGDNKELRGSFK